MVKNPKIRSCDLDLWPMTLKFSWFQAVEVLPSSWVRRFTSYRDNRKKLLTKTILSVATADSKYTIKAIIIIIILLLDIIINGNSGAVRSAALADLFSQAMYPKWLRNRRQRWNEAFEERVSVGSNAKAIILSIRQHNNIQSLTGYNKLRKFINLTNVVYRLTPPFLPWQNCRCLSRNKYGICSKLCTHALSDTQYWSTG